MTPDGRAKVLDFGLARRLPTEPEGAVPAATLMTAEGIVAGHAVLHGRPSCFAANRPTQRSDIWALGVLLYEMATGRAPVHRRHRLRAERRDSARAAGAVAASQSRPLCKRSFDAVSRKIRASGISRRARFGRRSKRWAIGTGGAIRRGRTRLAVAALLIALVARGRVDVANGPARQARRRPLRWRAGPLYRCDAVRACRRAGSGREHGCRAACPACC